MRFGWLIAALGMLIAAGPVSAQTRYAAPGAPHAGPCTQASPCSLEAAVDGAVEGQDVSVAPGTYTASTAINSEVAGLDVRGPENGPRPVLNTSAAVGLSVNGEVSDLVIVSSSGSAHSAVAAWNLKRVSAYVPAGAQAACFVSEDANTAPITVADTSCTIATGGRGLLISSLKAQTVTIRNVTARVLEGDLGHGLRVTVLENGGVVDVANTIARGASADISIGRVEPESAVSGTVNVTHSNYFSTSFTGGTINDDGTKQEAPPRLSPGGDPRQVADSPTRNAGSNAATTSPWDFEGSTRVLEGRVDIGADEFVPGPPEAVLGAAEEVTQTSARVTGTVDGKGLAGTARFELGETTGYGRTVEQAFAAGPAAKVQAAFGDLAPGRTYHYRLTVITEGGTATSTDGTLTTAAPPPSPPPPDVTAPRLTDVALTAGRFSLARGITALSAARRGTKLLYSVDEAATVTVVIERVTRGRRRGRRCVPGRRSGRRCVRYARLGTLTRKATPGPNRLSFTGRFGSPGLARALRPGRYRFVLRATDAAGNRSRAATVAFKVVRPRSR